MMQNYCRIDAAGIVQEVGQFATDPTGVLFHPSLIWKLDASGLAREGWVYSGTAFAAPVPPAPTVAQMQAVIQTACQKAITGGITSSALGASYTYPTQMTDQANLTANVVSSMLPAAQVAGWTTPQMCCSSSGTWAYVPHTAAQIQQVGNDVKIAIAAMLVKNATLQKQIAAATTQAAAQAVVW